MLDIKFIRENTELVKKAVKDKRLNLDLEHLLEIDKNRTRLIFEVEGLRSQRNDYSEQMKNISKLSSEQRQEAITVGKDLKLQIEKIDLQLNEIEKEYQELMYLVPNIASLDTPLGKDDSENVVIKTVGLPTQFNFEFKDHIQLGLDLDLLDLQRGVKVSGFRGYFLKNEAVLLHYGLAMYCLHKLISKGFTPMTVPALVKDQSLYGTGHFPTGKDEIYQIVNSSNAETGQEHNNLYLAGTAEVGLLGMYADETFKQTDLPLKLCGISQSYRSEIGSYGKDTKGLYRIHEFFKVEQFIFTKGTIEESNKYFELLREISEEILTELGLPYRVLQICTGDMGAGKYKMYDIETWMPSRNAYGETHSNSNLTDWQARRMNIKYVDEITGEKHYVHTLNNTAMASPRILIALWENYQQEDGSIAVPQVLRNYVGKDIITSKK